MSDPTADLIAERGKVYGEPRLSHENIGLSWTGMIQQHYAIRLDHPLPSHIVALMMVQLKAHRSARVYQADNYADLLAYSRFAENDQIVETNQNEQSKKK